MKILIATDAWHPQVNGVVRTLTSLARSASALDADVSFLTPDGFPSMALPTYPGLRIALPNRREIARRIEAAAPDAIHIATEGPVGWAVRAYCRRRKLAFTTSYTTRFPEYVEVRTRLPASVGYAVLRHFHAASSMVMVATDSLRQELGARGGGGACLHPDRWQLGAQRPSCERRGRRRGSAPAPVADEERDDDENTAAPKPIQASVSAHGSNASNSVRIRPPAGGRRVRAPGFRMAAGAGAW